MKNFFDNLGRRFSAWMVGRNGQDELSTAAYILGFVFFILSFFIGGMSLLALICWGYALFRMFSKNVAKRRAESAAFMEKTAPIRKKFNILKRNVTERRSYRYFECPKCKKTVRVPVGKGKIEITCPSCHEKFVKKT